MIKLPNNCRIGNISVFPKNWDKPKADIKLEWRINYRFFDYASGNKKQIKKMGMNDLHTLKERQAATQSLIEDELALLKAGYNPILNKQVLPIEENPNVPTERTPFCHALDLAFQSLDREKGTKKDINSVLKYVKEAAGKIKIDRVPISLIQVSKIKKRDIRAIFDYLAKKRGWSNNTYNFYRSHLMMIFKELSELDAVESNIPRELSKKQVIKSKRLVLTDDQRHAVKEKIINKNYRFWLFINMFFHSGARITEFSRLKVSDVNLDMQTAVFFIKKRKQWVREIKPIKDIALPFWREYLEGYQNGELFVISKNLYPGQTSISPNQITRRWRRWIKEDEELNICADFYSLKHLNTDEVSAQIGLEKAQKLNSHTSTRTTRIYAINEAAREMEIIKRVGNEF